MATVSKLRNKLIAELANNPGAPWTSSEAAVELLLGAYGFSLPLHDNIALTYLNSTNNVGTVTYKLGATAVATLTLTYVNAAAADNDLIATATLA